MRLQYCIGAQKSNILIIALVMDVWNFMLILSPDNAVHNCLLQGRVSCSVFICKIISILVKWYRR